MCPVKLFLVSFGLVLVTGELEYGRDDRKPKFLTFNSYDDDLQVNMEFSIPFLSIPVKKFVNSASGILSSGLPPININPTSLAVGGAILLGTTLLIPLLTKSYTLHYPNGKYSRLLDSAEFSADGFLDFASHMLSDGQTIPGCALRVACWTAQRSTKRETTKALSQIMSNNLISSIINGTTVEEAMLSGRRGRDCTMYAPCPLKEEHLPILLHSLSVLST